MRAMDAPTEIRTTESPAETAALAAVLAGSLRAGDVVVVRGEMGAGKTVFVRGACRALGIAAPLTSPTFTIGRLYELGNRQEPGSASAVAHLDLYRLGSLDDEEPGLLDDYINAATIAFVEWPDIAAAELDPAVEVRIAHAGGDRRSVEVRRPR